MLSSVDKRSKLGQFQEKCMQHTQALYRFAWRLTRNEHDTEDLVQETLLKAYRVFEGLPQGSNYRGWLFTVLRNGWLSKLRREGRVFFSDAPPEVATVGIGAVEHPMEGPVADMLDQMDDVIFAALQALPEVQRAAVLLCDVYELPYQDIARVQGCPIGTVRSRIFHARRRLRGALVGYASAEGTSPF